MGEPVRGRDGIQEMASCPNIALNSGLHSPNPLMIPLSDVLVARKTNQTSPIKKKKRTPSSLWVSDVLRSRGDSKSLAIK